MFDYLNGVWTYRSFINVPNPLDLRTEKLRETVDGFVFGQGELVFFKNFDGQIAGELKLLNSQNDNAVFATFSLVGSIQDGSPVTLRLQGKSQVQLDDGTEEEWIYDYLGYLIPNWPNGLHQRSAIAGSVIRTVAHSQGRARAGVVASFVAVKRDFPEPRDVIPLEKSVIEIMASRQHRLHHAVWHGVRDEWEKLSEAAKTEIRALGWEPYQPSLDAKDQPLHNNSAGEDFLFMHRQMIDLVKKLRASEGKTDSLSWQRLPSPQPANHQSGFAVPPFEAYSSNDVANRVSANLKSDDYFFNRFRVWEERFRDPAYLATLTLGQLGSLIEWSIHNSMHMRWATTLRDPETGEALSDATSRSRSDVSDKWNNPKYDWLGETYSSHVNPIFWRLHGWVDDRIEDWYQAHEATHPKEVEKITIEGITWFKPGRWVKQEKPWTGPLHGKNHESHEHEHAPGEHHHNFNEEDMIKILQIIEREVDAPESNLREAFSTSTQIFTPTFKVDLF